MKGSFRLESSNLNGIMTLLISNIEKLCDTGRILQDCKEWKENKEQCERLLQKLEEVQGHDTVSDLEWSIDIIKELEVEAAYLQGLKAGIALGAYTLPDMEIGLYEGQEILHMGESKTILELLKDTQPNNRKELKVFPFMENRK